MRSQCSFGGEGRTRALLGAQKHSETCRQRQRTGHDEEPRNARSSDAPIHLFENPLPSRRAEAPPGQQIVEFVTTTHVDSAHVSSPATRGGRKSDALALAAAGRSTARVFTEPDAAQLQELRRGGPFLRQS